MKRAQKLMRKVDQGAKPEMQLRMRIKLSNHPSAIPKNPSPLPLRKNMQSALISNFVFLFALRKSRVLQKSNFRGIMPR